MKYKSAKVLANSKHPRPRRAGRRVLIILAVVVAVLVAAVVAVRQVYYHNLQPVDSSAQSSQLFTVEPGATVDDIASALEEAGLIKSAWAFKLYVSSKQVRGDLQAGTYSFSPALSVSAIIAQLTHGKVATDSVTILPGQRLDQIREALINSGFTEDEVDLALDAAAYAGHPALVDKPAGANLEGYIYPETFHKAGHTTAEDIVSLSLDVIQEHLTPDIRAAFAQHGLNVFQGITLASIVEKESARHEDRTRIAQVFLKRLDIGMPLQADPTAFYGALLAGREPSLDFPSPYNTYQHSGLPPGPISNVSASSLQAVANPADTDWLYFVAGDDGTTHFARTLEDHERNIQQYCIELCP